MGGVLLHQLLCPLRRPWNSFRFEQPLVALHSQAAPLWAATVPGGRGGSRLEPFKPYIYLSTIIHTHPYSLSIIPRHVDDNVSRPLIIIILPTPSLNTQSFFQQKNLSAIVSPFLIIFYLHVFSFGRKIYTADVFYCSSS